MTLLLSMRDVEKSLSVKEVIDAVEQGYIAFNEGKVQQPDIVSMEMPQYNGETDIKSCYNDLNNMISVKIVSGFYDNGRINDLPTMLGTVILYDGKTGAPLCIMDGSLITGVRTGAAGAVSAKYLARKDSRRVAVIGSGGQARMQVYALNQVMNLDEVRVYNRSSSGLDEYVKDVEQETGLPTVPCATIEEALDGADIAVSTTPAKEYMVRAGLVKPGMHIIAVGADMAGKNEWDPEIFRGAKIVNDSISQCVSRGETRNALVKGIITERDIYAEIGQIIAGQKPGRQSDKEITIFDTTGMAIQDNVTAAMIYKAAVRKGLGVEFKFI